MKYVNKEINNTIKNLKELYKKENKKLKRELYLEFNCCALSV
jgi:hypothetical protein